MHNNATLGNKISRLARALCFWLRVLPSACKTELISFSSKLLVSFLTRFHRITSQPSDDSEPFAAQRNYFLIQSARDGALNKRLTQSVLSTHTRLSAQWKASAPAKIRNITSEHSADYFISRFALFSVLGKLSFFPAVHIIIGWAGARPAQQKSTSFPSCVCVNASELTVIAACMSEGGFFHMQFVWNNFSCFSI